MTSSDKNRKAEEYATNNPDFGGLLNIIYKYLTPETVQTLQLAFKQTYLAGYEAGQKDWGWVKIEEGCEMPEVLEKFLLFLEGREVFMTRLVEAGSIEEANYGVIKNDFMHASYWLRIQPPKEVKG